MNAMTQTAEVYEIKSGSYSPGKTNNAKGLRQMQEYVSGLQKSPRLPEGWKSAPGYTLNNYFSGKVIESKLYEGKKEIVYNVYENGMIIYYYRDKQEEGELEPSTVPVPQKEEERQRNWEKLLTPVGILAVTAVVGLFVVNLLENVLTGGIGIADDALCYSLMAAIILAVVGTNEVHGTEDCKAMS